MLAWMAHAACRGVDVNVFFPERGEPAAPARRICDDCRVWRECLDFAVSDQAPVDGIVAGLTGLERRRLRSELNRTRPSQLPTPRRRPTVASPFPRITTEAAELVPTRGWLLELRAADG